MSAITQAKNLGDLLKYEAPNLYSRETVTVAAGQNLQLGTVLGRKAADGKLYALAPSATDGTETAVGVLAADTDATLIDRDDAIAILRHAIVARSALIWPAGITAPQKAAAEAQLVALGILVRDAA
jgi:hypothetical protein